MAREREKSVAVSLATLRLVVSVETECRVKIETAAATQETTESLFQGQDPETGVSHSWCLESALSQSLPTL